MAETIMAGRGDESSMAISIMTELVDRFSGGIIGKKVRVDLHFGFNPFVADTSIRVRVFIGDELYTMLLPIPSNLPARDAPGYTDRLLDSVALNIGAILLQGHPKDAKDEK